jgi:PPP family 3-phenylpropionic acid transporter
MIPSKRTSAYLRFLYFLFFIGMGSCAPFASIFLKRVLVGADGKPAIELIGIIYSLLPFVGIIAGMAAGIVADRFHLGRKIIALCCLTSVASAILLAQAAEPWTVAWTLKQKFFFILLFSLVFGFGTGPIHGLLDAETLHFLNAQNAREKYGTFRLFGTYGWFVVTIIMGALLTQFHDLGLMYYGAAFGCLLLGIAALFGTTITGLSTSKPGKLPLSHLKNNRRFQIFLVFVFLNGLIYNSTTDYLGYFFDDIMKSFWQIGLIFGTWTIFEIPIMLYSRKIMTMFGNRNLIVAGMTLDAIRLILFASCTIQTPYFVKFLIALLQGPAFACTHIGLIDYIDRQAHENMRATYLNIATIAQNTIGASVGGILGSIIIKHLGSAALFRLGGFAIIGLVFFFYSVVKSENSKVVPEEKTF